MRSGRSRQSKWMLFPRLLGRMILLVLFFCCGFLLYNLAQGQFWPFEGQGVMPYSVDKAKDGRDSAGGSGEEKEGGGDEEAWQLILVNKWNPMPEDYQVELTELSNGQSVDSRIYPSLQKMFDDARSQGIYPTVASGYRTARKQKELMDEKIGAYEAEGCTRAEATRKAKKWVAVPGTSEHQLGLGVDINADGVHSKGKEVYDWLERNGYRYGFIHRYPEDKTEVTGISNEPWHYRYVGEKAAKEIRRRGVCLEEYLEEDGDSAGEKK